MVFSPDNLSDFQEAQRRRGEVSKNNFLAGFCWSVRFQLLRGGIKKKKSENNQKSQPTQPLMPCQSMVSPFDPVSPHHSVNYVRYER